MLETLRTRWQSRRLWRELIPRDPAAGLTRAVWVSVALQAVAVAAVLWSIVRGAIR